MRKGVNPAVSIVWSIAFFLLFSCASTLKKQDKSRDARFYNNRGTAYGEKGQYGQAISDFNTALEINPMYEKAYNNRGTTYRLMGEYDRAISDFNKALEINPLSPEAYNNLAWLLATAKTASFHNGKKAVELARKACELSEWKDPNYLDTLAAAYARVGDFENAVKWQEKAVESSASARKPELGQRLHFYRERKPWPEG